MDEKYGLDNSVVNICTLRGSSTTGHKLMFGGITPKETYNIHNSDGNFPTVKSNVNGTQGKPELTKCEIYRKKMIN